VFKLRNLIPFILKLMIELITKSAKTVGSYFIAVFRVKIVNAKCAQLKAYRVLTQFNSNLTMTTIFEKKTVYKCLKPCI